MEKKEVKTFNLITLGDSSVGKTSIINRYVKNQFNDNISSTLGMNFSYKEIKFNNRGKIILKLVDTAGQEKYRALTKSYFKNVDVVLFVFNLNAKETFDTIKDWMDLFKNNSNRKDEDVPKYLVGNKNDLKIIVDQNLIDKFARENGIPYISTSAKTKNNIDELFEEIGEKLYIDFLKKGNKGQNAINIKIIKKEHKNKCCFGKPDT
jgi:small GTP-binding protein